MMRTAILAALAILTSAPASAHRYCTSVTQTGAFGSVSPDLNNERTEYWVEEELTFLSNGERTRNVMFSGNGTPICSLEECERYKNALALEAGSTATMEVRAYCVPH